MKYTVVKSHNSSSLEESVNINLQNGWSLFGDLKVIVGNFNGQDFIEFYQAMIKDEKSIKAKLQKPEKAF